MSDRKDKQLNNDDLKEVKSLIGDVSGDEFSLDDILAEDGSGKSTGRGAVPVAPLTRGEPELSPDLPWPEPPRTRDRRDKVVHFPGMGQEPAPEEPEATEPEEAPCAGKPENPAGKSYPDWVDNLPRHIGGMIKRFGWFYGVRLAVGGALFTAIGCIARAMFKRMILGSMSTDYAISWGGSVPSEIVAEGFETSYFSSFNSQAWATASMFTGFIIFLGLVLTIGGILLAVVLKKWGSNSAE